MTTTITNRVISYFFLFDFYHLKGASDEHDLLPESIIYFYPPKEEIQDQKIVDCGEIIGLIQYLKYDLFSCIPKEFSYKKSLVTCEHYGRHCAFLCLSKDRFTIDEASIHLTHILQLSNMLYGTLNHIQSTHNDIHQIQSYLKEILTPIVGYVFNENRSIRNLFSAIDYVPLEKNSQRCLLHVKHFLSHLQTTYGVKNGLFAYEKRVLCSTFDTDTTFFIQSILGLEHNLPANEIYIPLRSDMKLRNGVSLIRIFIRRPLSLKPMLNAVDTLTTNHRNPPIISKPINMNPSSFSNETGRSPLNLDSNSMGYSVSISNSRYRNSVIQEDPAGSSGEATGFDTDQTGDISSPGKTGTSSIGSPAREKPSFPISPKDEFNLTNSHSSKEDSLPDDIKEIYQNTQSSRTAGITESIKLDPDSSRGSNRINQVIFVPMQYSDDDTEAECCEEDVICIPPISVFTNFQRTRQRTLTSYSDMNDGEHSTSENDEGHPKWGDTPDKNDETERDELVLYIQRNARMIFAGIIEKHSLSDEYLQKLWFLILTGMADMDKDIQAIPINGEISKHHTDIKFHFNDDTHQARYEQMLDNNHYYYKIPSADSACVALSARIKMNQHPDRKMIGLSKGNNLISITRYSPNSVFYSCRRFQEPH